MMAVVMSETQAASEDDQYKGLLTSISDRFAKSIADGARLFTTDATGLFDIFLGALPPERRQHYTCNACRRFVERFGGLVSISPTGNAKSITWDHDEAPSFFRDGVRSMQRAVERAKVTGVFLSEEKTWGLPQNKAAAPPGIWRHMAVVPPSNLVHKPSAIASTSQVIAEKLQDYGMLQRGIDEFPIEVVREAHKLLTTGALYRSEKCIGVAKWLLDLHEAREATKSGVARDNLTWLAVATAPAGFCHVRSSMIGTLLEDIAAGMAFDELKRRFDEKMDPLKYQRPQVAPSAGNIAQAEKIVAALRTAGALDRRFAHLEDTQTLWRPKAAGPEPASHGGVFGHLKPKEAKLAPQVDAPPTTMTWEKFARTVLPDAEAIEFLVPNATAPYSAMVTAANPDVPPILQWDREEQRNPVSWYLYARGSSPQDWNLKAGAYHRVTAVSLQPTMWYAPEKFAHQGAAVFFLLDGARDLRYERGAGFFPECLRSEYHGVRATMEAYARNAVVAGAQEATACGIKLQKGATWSYTFVVTSRLGRVAYKLDRWD